MDGSSPANEEANSAVSVRKTGRSAARPARSFGFFSSLVSVLSAAPSRISVTSAMSWWCGAMDRRGGLRRSGGIVPISSGTGLQPGRLFAGHPARKRNSWWPGGMVRVHDAIGPDPVRLCHGRSRIHGTGGRRFPARAQARRCRGRRTSRLGNGANPYTRSIPCGHRVCRDRDRRFLAGSFGQIAAIVLGACAGLWFCRKKPRRFPGISIFPSRG